MQTPRGITYLLLEVFFFSVLETERVPTSLALSKTQISGLLVTLDYTVDTVKLNESDGSSNLPQASSGDFVDGLEGVNFSEGIDTHLYKHRRRKESKSRR